MTFRGGQPGRPDPEKMLDDALTESFQELANRGSGVEAEDVIASQPQRRQPSGERSRSRPSRDEDTPERDPQSGRFLPREDRRTRRRSAQAAAGEDTADTEDLRSFLTDDEEDGLEDRRTTRRPRRTSARDVDPDEDEDPDEDDRPYSRRRSTADEDEDDDLDPEGAYGLEDDGDDEEDDDRPRQTRRRTDDEGDEEDDESDRGRRRTKRWSKRQEDAMRREVQRQVKSVADENERLRAASAQRAKIDGETATFLERALGSDKRRSQLEQVVLNTRLPQTQRDAAADELATYKRNSEFFQHYKRGAEASIQYEQAANDKAAMEAMRELRALDPKIIAKGDRTQTLVHAYATGRALGQQESAQEIKRLRRLLANARGTKDERSVRMEGRANGVPNSGNRRANGRVPRRDPLRGSMGTERGIRPGSKMPVVNDDIMQRIKDNELTLNDLGLGRVTL